MLSPQAKGYGAPELVTCGRDGCVRVWDVRQPDAPVAAFEPSDPTNIRLVLFCFVLSLEYPPTSAKKVLV